MHSFLVSSRRVGTNISTGILAILLMQIIFVEALQGAELSARIRGTLAALDDAHYDVRFYALERLTQWRGQFTQPEASTLVTRCAPFLSSTSNPELSALAGHALATVYSQTEQPPFEEAILKGLAEKLGSLLSNQSENARRDAIQGLISLGSISVCAADSIVEFLADDPGEVYLAAESLGRLREAPQAEVQPTATKVAGLLDQANKVKQLAALQALAEMQSAANNCLGQIVTFLNNQDPDLSAKAAYAIFRIGPGSGISTNTLIAQIATLTQKPFANQIRQNAILAIGKLAPFADDCPVDLAGLLRDPDLRSQTIEAIALMPKQAASQCRGLYQLLAYGEDTALRASAISAIGKIGEHNLRSNTDLADEFMGLVNSNAAPEVRSAALAAAVELRYFSQDHIDDLIKLLQERTESIRSQTEKALVGLKDALGTKQVSKLQTLLRFTDNDEEYEWGVRAGAVAVLGELGDESVVKSLCDLLSDEDETALRGDI
jgi:HEAT repeat protein